MKSKVKILIALFAILIIGLGFIEYEQPQEDKKQSATKKISMALQQNGIIVENVFISTGKEISEAFNITDAGIPEESKIAFIIFDLPSGAAISEGYVNAIYSALDADRTLDGAMAMNMNASSLLSAALIVYASRSRALEFKDQNLQSDELLDKWTTITYKPPMSYEDHEKILSEAFEKRNLGVRLIVVRNGTDVKSVINLTDEDIQDNSTVAVIPFIIGGSKDLAELHKLYYDIIDTAFSSDAYIDVVMTYSIDFAMAANETWFVYTDRATMYAAKRQNLTVDQTFYNFHHYAYNLTGQ